MQLDLWDDASFATERDDVAGNPDAFSSARNTSRVGGGRQPLRATNFAGLTTINGIDRAVLDW